MAANDIRRQTTLDITNANVSARRLLRSMRGAPRHTDVRTPAYDTEQATLKMLTQFVEMGERTRDSIDTLDTF